jgi:hypothetical protein
MSAPSTGHLPPPAKLSTVTLSSVPPVADTEHNIIAAETDTTSYVHRTNVIRPPTNQKDGFGPPRTSARPRRVHAWSRNFSAHDSLTRIRNTIRVHRCPRGDDPGDVGNNIRRRSRHPHVKGLFWSAQVRQASARCEIAVTMTPRDRSSIRYSTRYEPRCQLLRSIRLRSRSNPARPCICGMSRVGRCQWRRERLADPVGVLKQRSGDELVSRRPPRRNDRVPLGSIESGVCGRVCG